MKIIGLCLLSFVLGWSGAVWSYSDLIYSKIESPAKTVTPIEKNLGK